MTGAAGRQPSPCATRTLQACRERSPGPSPAQPSACAVDLPVLIANALALGAAYALVALGFVLVLNAVGAVNFAQGDLCVAGGFLAAALAQRAAPALGPWTGLALLPVVALALAALGWAIERLAVRPLAARPPVAAYIATIAVGLMLEHALAGLFGAAPLGGPALLPPGPGGTPTLTTLGHALPRQSVAMAAVAGVLLLAVHLLLAHSWTGRRLRAAAQDPETARAVGIPAGHLAGLSFALAAALAGIAGLLLSHQYFVVAGEGAGLMVKAYIAATLGGWGRIGGAVIGALLIAAFETAVGAAASPPLAEALLYACVLVLLLVRPQGLLGEPYGRRA
ncbi:MAG: branched-chain amino acid ABC transporter permease [Alphaproteobacteria bacterium]|nr:branched-chain amino acid ABC transporter permease [Alphaproteobacteria bacterium]